jgi:Putative restriction endonuclease
VRTIVLEPKPAVFEALLERRRALGQDLYDEVWEGDYHMAPAPHSSHGYVGGQLAVLLHPSTTYVPTAALVVEVVSPGDETWQKLGFYAAHSVDELLIADPAKRAVTWLVLHGGRYVEAEYNPLLRVDVAKLTEQINWPTVPTVD